MCAKEFLGKYLKLGIEIKNLEEELQELNDMVLNITPQSEGERVQTTPVIQDKIGEMVSKICDVTIELIKRRDKAIDTRKEVFDTIMEVEHKEKQRILYLRYIKGYKWERIAVDINRDYRWTLRLHGQALKEIEEIISHRKPL